MATDNIQEKPVKTSYVFDLEFVPCPPGTKSPSRLPRGMEPYPLPARAWWLIGATAVVMLVVGVLIGRFVVP